jgi:hypothetical protein
MSIPLGAIALWKVSFGFGEDVGLAKSRLSEGDAGHKARPEGESRYPCRI